MPTFFPAPEELEKHQQLEFLRARSTALMNHSWEPRDGFDYPGAEDISRGTAIDVIEIDGASNTSVNDVRAIKDEILFPPPEQSLQNLHN